MLYLETCSPLVADETTQSKFDSKTDSVVDFQTDVIPVLTKMGCNAGACHGSAAGRGGFKLSLYGSQPADDYRAMVRDRKGRRINRVDSASSLIIRKPTADLEHGGDHLFDIDQPPAKVLLAWLDNGAKFDSTKKLSHLDVGKSSLIFPTKDSQHQFKFVATFSDGTKRDVTHWTVLKSDDPTSVSVDDSTNRATIHRAGRHVLIARFLHQVVPIEIIVPFYESKSNDVSKTSNNFVDQLINQKLAQLNIPVAGSVDESDFVRRVSLDLTGQLPKENDNAPRLSDDSRQRRQQLVDELLSGDQFTDFWTYRIATQLRMRSQQADKTGVLVYHNWLRNEIARNTSWKKIAQSLVLSNGDSHQNGPANFYRTTGDARLQSEFVTESLLGVKLRCANCHNHPLDHWTQDDYHGLAAIFSKVKQSRFVTLNPAGENIHARTGQPAKPRVPGESFLNESTDDRIPLAKWMLDDTNPYFARAMVNRIWQSLMGRGLVEPVDDLRSTNPATHPELLKRLADDFVEHEFDIRHTIGLICSTDAYQRSVGDPGVPEFHRQFYANANVRPLPPEVLADAIGDVTGIADSYPGFSPGTRAIQLPDPKIPSASLDILGRCSREEACESDTQAPTGALSTQLHLLNGDLVNKKLFAPKSHLRNLIDSEASTKTICEKFYRLAYSRMPTDKELGFWIEKIDQSKSQSVRQQNLEDFLWSILNSKEFRTNH